MTSWTFIKENYFMIGYVITLFVSLATYRKYYDTALKYFPIIIAYTLFNEILGYLVRNYNDISFFQNLKYSNFNDIIYNIYAVIFFGFFFRVYWGLIDNPKYRKWIMKVATVTILAYLLSLLFQNPLDTNLYYAIAIGSWSLIFCIILYFRNKMDLNQKIYQPYNLMFWVSLALLSFYIIFPFLYIIGYIAYDIWVEYELRAVLRLLIAIMYGILIFGFIKARRKAFS